MCERKYCDQRMDNTSTRRYHQISFYFSVKEQNYVPSKDVCCQTASWIWVRNPGESCQEEEKGAAQTQAMGREGQDLVPFSKPPKRSTRSVKTSGGARLGVSHGAARGK